MVTVSQPDFKLQKIRQVDGAGALFKGLGDVVNVFKEKEKNARRDESINQALGLNSPNAENAQPWEGQNGNATNEEMGLLNLSKIDPQMAGAVGKILERRDARELKAEKEHATEILRQVVSVESQPTHEKKREVLGELQIKAASEGRSEDAKELTEFLNLREDDLKAALATKKLVVFSAAELLKVGAEERFLDEFEHGKRTGQINTRTNEFIPIKGEARSALNKALINRDNAIAAGNKEDAELYAREARNLVAAKDPAKQNAPGIVRLIASREKFKKDGKPKAAGEVQKRIDKLTASSEKQNELEIVRLLKKKDEFLQKGNKNGAKVIQGRIDKLNFIAKKESGGILKDSEIQDTGKGGFVVLDNGDGTFSKTKVLDTAKVGDSGKASAVTKIFDDGTTIQALPSGAVEVKGPDGSAVTGQERLDVLKSAKENEIAFAQTKAGATKAGSEAIILSSKTFEKLERIKPAIENIDKAIAAIDAGAKTGAVASQLPSIRAASVQLDNIQASMGLDVIGNTTFGALSESELSFALSTAMPKNLPPKALKKWLLEKRAAQVKLADYLENVAVYLGTPGNTVAGWITAQQSLADFSDQGNQPAGGAFGTSIPTGESGRGQEISALPQGFEVQ